MPDNTDDRLDDIQEQIDRVRASAADNPGVDIIDEDDVPAYFDEDEATAAGGITKQEAEQQASDNHQGHAPFG